MASVDDTPMAEVSAQEAIALVADGTLLVDVREQDEWDAGHAPDARLVPLSELEQRASELPTDTRFLVVCHSGMRSMRATSYLLAQGFDAVNVSGGMVAWAQAGGSLEANANER